MDEVRNALTSFDTDTLSACASDHCSLEKALLKATLG